MLLLSVAEAAGMLGISESRVCELVRRGKLRAMRWNSDYMIDPLSVRERLAATPNKGGRPQKTPKPLPKAMDVKKNKHKAAALVRSLIMRVVR